jgi:hypothetical protein
MVADSLREAGTGKANPMSRKNNVAGRAVVDLTWASISIWSMRPERWWRPINTLPTGRADRARLLNHCKLFPYNQLSRVRDGGMANMARRVHWAACITTGEAPMAHTHRVSTVPAEELPADLLRLATSIRALPDEYSRDLVPALERVVESTKRRRRILTLVQDALSQLRLDMKYLMFDLEATRRERDEYHAKLQEFES